MTFLNVVEIESALQGLATRFPDRARLIALPFRTHEGRQCHALSIGAGSRCPSAGALIISGVHARERGGPDICINFAADLLEAHAAGTGLLYGAAILGVNGIWFTPDQIRKIIERLDVIVFPCVNPDGYQYALTTNQNWRKNRNPASSGGRPGRIGVDVNRNFDFVWDFATAFHPSIVTAESAASANPAEDTFHGTAPFSEPESRNVAWLFDRFPQIGHFVDVHSYGGDILHPWGTDENQTTTPAKNFTNPAWHGKRGVASDAYGEFIPAGDRNRLSSLAGAMRSAIFAVRGETYAVSQGFWLPSQNRYYPTSGASECWAFSRRFTDPRKRAVDAFTIEFNRKLTFLVTWNEMQSIIPEIDAALIRLCVRATPIFTLPDWVCNFVQWIVPPWPEFVRPDIWGPYGPLRRIPAAFGAVYRLLTLPFRRG